MKSEHRHDLKTNELADWLAHFPQWAKQNQTTLIAVAAVVVVAVVVYFVKSYRADVVPLHHQERLTGLVMQLPAQKRAVAQAAAEGTDQSFALRPIAEDLEDFAKKSDDDNMAALAWIKRGEALRTEIHYRPGDMPRDELAQRIAQAQASYNAALERAPKVPALAAMAQLGLGLCEEELGNFDAAAELYRKVKDNADYQGTTAQVAAAERLVTMDDYKTAVVFKPAPAPKPEGASAPTVQIGPGATNSPIKIEMPEGGVPTVVTPPAVPESSDVPAPAETPSPAAPAKATESNEPAGG